VGFEIRGEKLMYEYIGSEAFAKRFPQPGYLASAMMMFDRFEHEIAAFQWLEYRLPQFAIADILAAFPNTLSLVQAATYFEGNEAQIIACEHLESLVDLEIIEEFWDRFLMLIIDRNTLVLT
jgi:hypothetical protein